ncbi:pseudouridine synthase [Bifidobacterium scardovii JCM 12489 = DSM 13734]|uniref:pseudouridine synthase n=3 Tax=Bifidobacterium scardovii TaxID=158787 RepID=UPI0005B563E7|nr:pseudouridine synthase [Bifidobacterium scardovii JCM 12489 = DSM 13734]
MTDEPHIPFDLSVLYEDERIIVVDKPHFLATTPRGMWHRETALIRLRERYGDPGIIPAHRLDRLTAGIVVFVRDPAVRGAYQMLFQGHRAVKTYECVAPARPVRRPRYGTIERLEPPRVFPLRRRSRIVKRRGVLQAYEEPGAVNAETVIELGVPGGSGMVGGVPGGSGMVGGVPGGSGMVGGVPGGSGMVGGVPGGSGISGGFGGFGVPGGLVTASARDSAVPPPGCAVRAYTLHPRTGKTHQLRVTGTADSRRRLLPTHHRARLRRFQSAARVGRQKAVVHGPHHP